MKITTSVVINGFNDPLVSDDILDFDGVKLRNLSLFIVGIDSKEDIDTIIDRLKIIREGFIK